MQTADFTAFSETEHLTLPGTKLPRAAGHGVCMLLTHFCLLLPRPDPAWDSRAGLGRPIYLMCIHGMSLIPNQVRCHLLTGLFLHRLSPSSPSFLQRLTPIYMHGKKTQCQEFKSAHENISILEEHW